MDNIIMHHRFKASQASLAKWSFRVQACIYRNYYANILLAYTLRKDTHFLHSIYSEKQSRGKYDYLIYHHYHIDKCDTTDLRNRRPLRRPCSRRRPRQSRQRCSSPWRCCRVGPRRHPGSGATRRRRSDASRSSRRPHLDRSQVTAHSSQVTGH